MAFKHKSVLLDETIEGLNIKPDGIYVDGTLGGGGHAYEVCRRLNNKGSFIGIDQDAAAIEAADLLSILIHESSVLADRIRINHVFISPIVYVIFTRKKSLYPFSLHPFIFR